MADDKICLNCGKPFKIKRNFRNRNADIRYCGKCKEDPDHVHQAERAKTSRGGSRGPRTHLARN